MREKSRAFLQGMDIMALDQWQTLLDPATRTVLAPMLGQEFLALDQWET